MKAIMKNFQADIDRYRTHPQESGLVLVLRNQGLWALAVYRFFHPLVTSKSSLVQKLGKIFGYLASKWIEIVTGIALNPATQIGEGLYLGHFGGIVIHPDVKIGRHCVIMHGVTLGNSGKVSDPPHYVPHLGNRVYLGIGAVLTGCVSIGDDCVVGANAVLNKSLPARAVALGAPARIISHKGSFEYIRYSGMETDEDRNKSFAFATKASDKIEHPTEPTGLKAEKLFAKMGSQP